jgi:hypothetical protein
MRKLIFLILSLFVFGSAYGQDAYTSDEQEIYLGADTVTGVIFNASPNALLQNIVVCNDTTVTDTLEFYKVTPKGDTLGLTLRLCEDWSGTSDISIRTVVPSSTCKEYFIVNPVSMQKLFIRVKGILTNSMTEGIQYRIYTLKNKLD